MCNDKVSQVPAAANRLRSLAWLPLLSMALLATLSVAVAAQAQEVDMKKVEAAVLKEDWKEVADDLLKDVTNDPQKSPNPVLRLIKGHACLALNRNNESVCLFLSVVVPEDLERCRSWADGFANRNAKSAIAHYCAGDVSARLRMWDLATKALNRADQLHPKHYLVLNTRGLVHVAMGQHDEALCDFDEATQANAAFADGYANHGMLNIQNAAGAEGALRVFNRALDNSKDFAIALTGRGCIQLVLGKLPEAKKDFELAKSKSGCMEGMVDENVRRMLTYVGLLPDADLGKLSKADLGMELSKRQTAFFQNPDQKNTNNYMEGLRLAKQSDPNLYGKHMTEMGTFARMSPSWASSAGASTVRGLSTNDKFGWGAFGASAIPKDVNIVVGVGGMGIQKQIQQVRASGFNTFNDMNRALGSPAKYMVNGQRYEMPGGALGGVAASLEALRIDDGNWPFVAYYGLCYPRTSQQEKRIAKGDVQ